MGIYSCCNQTMGMPIEQINGSFVSYNWRKEQLRLQMFGVDFAIPFTTKWVRDKWLWSFKDDSGYSCRLIREVKYPCLESAR